MAFRLSSAGTVKNSVQYLCFHQFHAINLSFALEVMPRKAQV